MLLPIPINLMDYRPIKYNKYSKVPFQMTPYINSNNISNKIVAILLTNYMPHECTYMHLSILQNMGYGKLDVRSGIWNIGVNNLGYGIWSTTNLGYGIWATLCHPPPPYSPPPNLLHPPPLIKMFSNPPTIFLAPPAEMARYDFLEAIRVILSNVRTDFNLT